MPLLQSRPWLILPLAIVAFVGGALAVQSWTLSLLLRDDARTTAGAWAAYLATKTPDLDRIAAGAGPAPETVTFLDGIMGVSRMFRYRIFDAGGTLVFESGRGPDEPGEDDSTLLRHNPAAATATAHGETVIETHSGDAADGPRYYAEAYAPTFADGRLRAVVEASIDQTAKRAQFAEVSCIGGVGLGILVALAFGLPAMAWYRGEGEKRKSSARLHYLAKYDALSNLPNRVRLSEELDRILADAGPKRRLAVLKINIDGFGDLNMWLGHSAGDQIIRVVAERLRTAVAPDDTGDLVARIAGDEFAVVHRTADSRASAMILAERICRSIARPFNVNNRQVRLSAGIGVALTPADGDDGERLMKSATLALAHGKLQGRGRIQFFTPDLDSEMEARRIVEQAVANAFATGGFTVHYQPIYAAGSGALAGFEALARLPREDGGLIQPAVFVPAIERMGMINQLGAWMLSEACTAAAAWPEHMTVSVNLSALQFAAPGISDAVAAALHGSGLAPSRLHLEITESVLLGDHDAVMTELTKLKALGTGIVMDDFGTGYSSLSYLWRFPFDKIKIDGSFMTGLEGPGAPAEKIMRAITSLGHSLGMVVCVEGVETHLHAASAQRIGCDQIQGFHFGRPLPATELPALILSDFRRSLGAASLSQQSAAGAAL